MITHLLPNGYLQASLRAFSYCDSSMARAWRQYWQTADWRDDYLDSFALACGRGGQEKWLNGGLKTFKGRRLECPAAAGLHATFYERELKLVCFHASTFRPAPNDSADNQIHQYRQARLTAQSWNWRRRT